MNLHHIAIAILDLPEPYLSLGIRSICEVGRDKEVLAIAHQDHPPMMYIDGRWKEIGCVGQLSNDS